MFHEVLIESVPRRPRGIVAGVPFSVAIHGLVIATAVVLSARGVEEPPDPVMPVIFQISSPPPSGPNAPTARGAVPVRRVEERPFRVVRAELPPATPPSSVPAAHSDEPGEASGPSSNNADENAGESGNPNGVPGGTGTDPFSARAGQGSAPIPVGGDVRPPRLIERVDPVYPDAARTVRAQGLVILEAVITAGGRVEEVRVLRSPDSLLAASAVSAVERWRYLPATLNGRPVKVFLTVTVDFRLH